MIAKKIPRKGPSRAARLVKYMVAAKGETSPETWQRTADYILDTGGETEHGEKVAGWRVTNCGTDDPAEACTAIEATQRQNTTAKGDKTYHLVYSFPAHEKPDIPVLHALEDELVKSIGLEKHQRISAIHINTDYLHVHVAINKIDPETLRMIEPYKDIPKLMEACERLEIEHGLTRTNHGMGREKQARVPGRAADMAAHNGVEPLISYLSSDVAPGIRDAKSWAEVHSLLGEHGLEIKPRGAGLVIGSPDGPWVRASSVGRDLSLAGLTKRLGPYTPAGAEPLGRYTSRPSQRHPAAAKLWAKYQEEKQAARAQRNWGMAEIARETRDEFQRARQWGGMQRILAKGAKGPLRKIMNTSARNQSQDAFDRIKREAKAKRKLLISQTRQPTWAEWLAQRASDGDLDALEVLRARAKRDERALQLQQDVLSGSGKARNCLLRALAPKARADGSVLYRTADGGIVVDRATHVQARTATTMAAMVALEIAAKRFEGQALDIRGTEEFRTNVAKLAGIHKINVSFTDPALEAIRQGTQKGQEKPDKRPKRKDKGIEI